jgi:hypothetical protein
VASVIQRKSLPMSFRLPILSAVTALVLSATPSFAAPPCALKDSVEIDTMSKTKSAFASFDSDLMLPLFQENVSKTAIENLFSQVKTVAPDGFDSCQTMLQRLETGGMVQEVSIFVAKGGGPRVFFYALGVPNETGDTRLHVVNFNTDIDEILALLH